MIYHKIREQIGDDEVVDNTQNVSLESLNCPKNLIRKQN